MAVVRDAVTVVAEVALDAAGTRPDSAVTVTEPIVRLAVSAAVVLTVLAVIAAVVKPVKQCCVVDPSRAPVVDVSDALVAVAAGPSHGRGLHRGKSVSAWVGRTAIAPIA